MRYSSHMIDSGRHQPSGLWSLILAAGGSSRLGTPKQLLRIHAQPLLCRAIMAAENNTPDQVLVVLGAHALKLRLLLNRRHPNVYTITNTNWLNGMASSLAVGLSALPARASAALLILSDQPGVNAQSLRRLVHAWNIRPRQAVAAHYEGRSGAPAVIPRKLWAIAKKFTGDIGARHLLRDGDIVPTIVPMPEAVFDVDTEQDQSRLANRDFRR